MCLWVVGLRGIAVGEADDAEVIVGAMRVGASNTNLPEVSSINRREEGTYSRCYIRGANIANVLDSTFTPSSGGLFPNDPHYYAPSQAASSLLQRMFQSLHLRYLFRQRVSTMVSSYPWWFLWCRSRIRDLCHRQWKAEKNTLTGYDPKICRITDRGVLEYLL